MSCTDAQAMAILNKGFECPTLAELAAIIPDDYVKVCIDEIERIWCQVASIDGVTINAIICNEPVMLDELELGDPVQFEMRHVYDIISDGEKS